MAIQFQGKPSRQATAAAHGLRTSKLKEARLAQRLTQTDLAALVGKTRQAISAYEQGEINPEPDVMDRIASKLHQPLGYFSGDPAQEFGESSLRFFRAFGPKTKRRNLACEVFGGWLARTAKYLDEFVNYPRLNIPSAEEPTSADGRYTQEEIESAAALCRKAWNLGLGPISNVVSLLENNGVIVCRYVIQDEQVEAFSFWNGPKALIFLASDKDSACRARFDAAHELGHLVLHRGIGAEEIEGDDVLKAIEREADLFAGAFLLPKASFLAEVFSTRLDAFFPLKLRWKVSAAAMIRRCHHLGAIDDDQYLNLQKTISFRKIRKREPHDGTIPMEEPKLLNRAATLLLSSGHKSPDEIATGIQIDRRIIEQFCNLAIGALNLNPQATPFRPTIK